MAFSRKIDAQKLMAIKNRPTPHSEASIKYDVENVKKICDLYLNNGGISIVGNEVYITSNYIYNGFPPKTKRIIFRNPKEVHNRADITNIISQIEFVSKGKYRVRIVNKISQSEFSSFIEKLKILKNENFKESFIENADIDVQHLVVALSTIDNVRNDFLLEKGRTYNSRVFSLMPISDNIKNKIKETYNIEYVDENEYLDMNSGNGLEYLDNFYNEFGQLIVSVCSIEDTKPSIDLNDEKLFENMVLNFNLPKPSYNDVTVGVIDTGFKVPEIFKPWVEGTFCEVPEDEREFIHGTTVSSLIIANDELNSSKDGFGHFKVMHFELLGKSSINGISKNDKSFFELIKNLRKIIADNYRKIKIWNISFVIGRKDSIFSISKFARILDELSYQYNILFVVSSGNFGESETSNSLGGGSDGMNVLSVGAVQRNKDNVIKSEYSSIGRSNFLVKPDVATYGGEYDLNGDEFISYDGTRKIPVKGTSYSAPLITRLAAFLLREGYTLNRIKCRIINMAERMTNKFKAASFGYINHKPDDMKCFYLSGQLSNNAPKILKVNLPNVNKMSIAISFYANPANDSLVEYCYNSIDFKVYRNKHNKTITPKNFYEECESLKAKGEDYHKFNNEIRQRSHDGKYSTVWKRTFEFKNDDTSVDEHYLYLKLLNLHTDYFEDENVDYALEIFFEDADDEGLLLKENEDIIEAEAEVEMQAEAEAETGTEDIGSVDEVWRWK
jgi:subtilisin family serine protease